MPSMGMHTRSGDGTRDHQGFNAVAEPRRRAILDVLGTGERPVGDLRRAARPRAAPQVSKHLRVLRDVGAVEVRDAGRGRLYRVNGAALKPIHDWVGGFERAGWERSTPSTRACTTSTTPEKGAAGALGSRTATVCPARTGS